LIFVNWLCHNVFALAGGAIDKNQVPRVHICVVKELGEVFVSMRLAAQCAGPARTSLLSPFSSPAANLRLAAGMNCEQANFFFRVWAS